MDVVSELQVKVKDLTSSGDTNFNTLYYTVDDDGIATRVGSFKMLMDEAGDASMSFTTINNDGEQVSLMDMSPSGINLPGLGVAGGSIALGSVALELADIDQGGLVLGTEISGTKSFLYQSVLDTWSTNAGVNVEAGYGITVANDEVVLNEAGLNLSR